MFTFEDEGFKFVIDPLLEHSLTFDSFFLQPLKTAVEFSFGCLDPCLDCPTNFFLFALLILDLFLNVRDHFQDFCVLFSFNFLPIKEFVLLLVELIDESTVHLRFL